MRKWSICFIAVLLASACRHVNDLSDEARVEQFAITSLRPDKARAGEVSIEPGKIRVGIYPDEGIFPVSFRATVKNSPGTDAVLHLPDTFRFDTSNAVETFYLIAESGAPHPHEVSLQALPTGADVLGLTVEGATAAIDPWNAAIRLSVAHLTFPYAISPRASLPDGASATGIDTITFARIDEVKRFPVTSADGAYSREWSCSIEGPVQLVNSSFEEWSTSGTVVNILPAKVWGTANNYMVQGTLPVEHDGGKAAEMTTNIQTVPLFNHQLIAAGTLYTGHFSLNLNFENPRSMTYFGVPHDQRVSAVSFDARYIAGPRLQHSVKVGSKYQVENIDGVDQGEAWVEMLHWAGSGELAYHGVPVDSLTVLGRGNIVFDGADKTLEEWKNVTMPILYTNDLLAATHLVIVFSSSKEGDVFKGADGSKLAVDNVILLY
ncbi:MAG: PCMD domain-containing protein [Odoribacteraceae bacterium]|jgi:hypothetical protein|nr:PCMD domain-containing protein [Odoribacteraceae bacterium]